jgi:hypothetical protein
MTSRVWINPRQPQTLYIAQILMYFQGAMALLAGFIGWIGEVEVFGSATLGALWVLLMTVGLVAAAFGIANQRRWGYRLAVVAVCAPLLLRVELLFRDGPGSLFRNPLDLLFSVALVALVLHPLSVAYQKVWFS